MRKRHMLDCHIIVSPHTPSTWVNDCVDSVREAADQAGFPVDIHYPPYFPGHIGKSRAIGYSMGAHPYVTCVDDDDWVAPTAFRCLRSAMLEGHAAIYTRETQWQNGKPTRHNLRQHLRVFRRDVVASFNFDPWPALDSTALIAHADTFGPCIRLMDRVYNYTVDPQSSARRIYQATPDLHVRELKIENVHE